MAPSALSAQSASFFQAKSKVGPYWIKSTDRRVGFKHYGRGVGLSTNAPVRIPNRPVEEPLVRCRTRCSRCVRATQQPLNVGSQQALTFSAELGNGGFVSTSATSRGYTTIGIYRWSARASHLEQRAGACRTAIADPRSAKIVKRHYGLRYLQVDKSV